MSIEALIYTRLSGFAGLTALVATRIYPNVAPQNVAPPYVVYRRITATRPGAMGADTGIVRARFQFDVFAGGTDAVGAAQGFDDAAAVREQVRLALQRWRSAGPPVVQATFLDSQIDLYEDDTELHHLADDYEINYLEA